MYNVIDKAMQLLEGKEAFTREGKSLDLYNFMGTECKTIAEVASTNRITDRAAAVGVLQSPEASYDLRYLAWKSLHASNDDHSTDVMIAFQIMDDQRIQLAMPDGEPWQELHITLGYFGEPTENNTREKLVELTKSLADSFMPFAAKASGLGRFSSDDGDDACVVLMDDVMFPLIYERMQELCRGLEIDYSPTHGYTPHMTLGYLNKESKMPLQRWSIMSLPIQSLALHWGTEVLPFALSWSAPEPSELKDVYHGTGNIPPKRKKGKAVIRRNRFLAQRLGAKDE